MQHLIAAETSFRSLGPLTGKIIMDKNNPLQTARYTEHMALLYVSMSLRGATHEFNLRPRK